MWQVLGEHRGAASAEKRELGGKWGRGVTDCPRGSSKDRAAFKLISRQRRRCQWKREAEYAGKNGSLMPQTARQGQDTQTSWAYVRAAVWIEEAGVWRTVARACTFCSVSPVVLAVVPLWKFYELFELGYELQCLLSELS